MGEKRKNGSAALPAAGTVTNNPSANNTTTHINLYQGEIYTELEEYVVDAAVERFRARGCLNTASFREIANQVQLEMRGTDYHVERTGL